MPRLSSAFWIDLSVGDTKHLYDAKSSKSFAHLRGKEITTHLAAIDEAAIPDVFVIVKQNLFVDAGCVHDGVACIAGLHYVGLGAILAFNTQANPLFK